jgi:hypothetical protein
MADTLIQIPVDSTGKKLRAFSAVIGTDTVYQQAIVVVDSSGNIVDVLNSAPGGTERAIVVRNIPSGTQAVSGTVTANAGTNLNTSALALDASLTGGTQKAINRGGAKGATSASDVTSTAQGADHQALDVQLYHGSAAVNPQTIRALTSADVVTAQPGNTANTTPWLVEVRPPTVDFYNFGIVNLGPAANANDIIELKGSASKTIKVYSVVMSATQATGGLIDLALVKRSTADSGGTSGPGTIIARKASSPATTASVRLYTANPTLGTLVGIVDTKKMWIGTTTDGTETVSWDCSGAPVILSAATESFCINTNSAMASGTSWNVSILWSEQ